jgi:hypothetical protein
MCRSQISSYGNLVDSKLRGNLSIAFPFSFLCYNSRLSCRRRFKRDRPSHGPESAILSRFTALLRAEPFSSPGCESLTACGQVACLLIAKAELDASFCPPFRLRLPEPDAGAALIVIGHL